MSSNKKRSRQHHPYVFPKLDLTLPWTNIEQQLQAIIKQVRPAYTEYQKQEKAQASKKKKNKKAPDKDKKEEEEEEIPLVELTADVVVWDRRSAEEKAQKPTIRWWAGQRAHNVNVMAKCAAANQRSFCLPGKFPFLPHWRPVRSPKHVLEERGADKPDSTTYQLRQFHNARTTWVSSQHASAQKPQQKRWYSDQWTTAVDCDSQHMIPYEDAVMGQGLVEGKLFCSEVCATFLQNVYEWVYNALWLERHANDPFFFTGLDWFNGWIDVFDHDRLYRRHYGSGHHSDEDEDLMFDADGCGLDVSTMVLKDSPPYISNHGGSGCSRVNFWDKVEGVEASSATRELHSFCSRCQTPHVRKLLHRQATAQSPRIYNGAEAVCTTCVLFLEETYHEWEACRIFWQCRIPLPDHWQPMVDTVYQSLLHSDRPLIYTGTTKFRNGSTTWCHIRGSLCRNGQSSAEIIAYVYFGDDCRVGTDSVDDDVYEKEQLKALEGRKGATNHLIACACCMEEFDLFLRTQRTTLMTSALKNTLCADVLSVIAMFVSAPYRNPK